MFLYHPLHLKLHKKASALLWRKDITFNENIHLIIGMTQHIQCCYLKFFKTLKAQFPCKDSPSKDRRYLVYNVALSLVFLIQIMKKGTWALTMAILSLDHCTLIFILGIQRKKQHIGIMHSVTQKYKQLEYLEFPDKPFSTLCKLWICLISNETSKELSTCFGSCSRQPVIKPLLKITTFFSPLDSNLHLQCHIAIKVIIKNSGTIILLRRIQTRNTLVIAKRQNGLL